MPSKLEIKARIKSVDSTKKITKAMQLVAGSKLRKCKERMIENKEYAKYLRESVNSILSSLDNVKHPYLTKNDSDKVLTIIYTSDMGLCGGYNANIYKLIEECEVNDNPVIVFGSRGIAYAKRISLNVVETFYNVDDEGYEDINRVASLALDMYTKQEISGIDIMYSQFINAVTFIPKKVSLLPVEKDEDATPNLAETIFEPSGEEILDSLVPMYVKSLLYSYWLETKTSEQASRQSAMENATNNAEELRDGLALQFNKARQAAITQEITEIVGGASAL